MSMFRFGEFEADEERFELRRSGHVVRVQRRVLQAIFHFLRSRGHVVTKRDLIRGPWSGNQVSDAAVSRAIMLARRAIADPSARVLTTVHGTGYRFVLDVAATEFVDRCPGSAPFEGRSLIGAATRRTTEDAMESLRATFAQARQRRGSIVVVSGATGAGKTTLVERFARELEDQGALVAWGSAWCATDKPPLWPWRQIVSACATTCDEAGTVAVALDVTQILKALDRTPIRDASHRRRDGEPDPHLAGKSSGKLSDKVLRIFEAVAQLLTELASRRPLVAIIEDLDCADDASELLVEFLRQRIWRTALLLVITRGSLENRGVNAFRFDEKASHVQRLRLAGSTCGARTDAEQP